MSIAHGFRGPIGAPVTACAAGAQAIGDAARMIRSGEADIALCGGAEAAIHRVSLAGFAAARALSSASNDQPEAASRPFDRDRDGFVMGEGAGLIVIESLEHALARGATPLAELVGYGTSADAYHLTAGPEDGNGARRAMETAIRQAGVTVDEHWTISTPTPPRRRSVIKVSWQRLKRCLASIRSPLPRTNQHRPSVRRGPAGLRPSSPFRRCVTRWCRRR